MAHEDWVCIGLKRVYRQLHMIWRLQGLWQYLRGDNVSVPMKRKGLQSAGVQ